MLSNDADALDYFYRSYATSVTGRRNTTLYTEDPRHGFEIEMDSERSKVVDKMNALLRSVGLDLVIEYDEDYDSGQDDIDIEKSYDPGVDKFPKYIRNKEYNNHK